MKEKERLPRTRRAVLLDRAGHFVHTEIPMPKAADHEVLIRVQSVGICGSDLNYYHKGGSTIAQVRFPHLLGHELSGTVEAVGSGVKDVSPGDRVAIEPGYPCGTCEYCRTGTYNLCPEVSFMSTPIYRPYSEGAFTEYTLRPDWGLYKIPASVSYEEAAMIEPLAVGMQAVETAGAREGMTAVILGCGPIAMCILLTLRAAGIAKVYMVDVLAERVKMAEELGARKGFLKLDMEEINQIAGDTRGLGADLVFDTTDYTPLINQAVLSLKKGGRLLLLAVPHQEMISLNMLRLFTNQITVLTSFRYANQFEKAVRQIESGRIPIGKIITHRFPFEEAERAMEQASKKSGRTCKVVVNW